MKRDIDRSKVFTRRALIIGGAQAGLLSLLVGRMYYLQVVEGEKYTTLANENRVSVRLLAPTRGRIVDRRGVPLADSRQNYRVSLIAERTSSAEASLRRLDMILQLSEAEKRRILREVQRNRRFVPIPIRENLTWDEVAQIEFNAPDLPGIFVEGGQLRDYAGADAFSHLIGYVAAVNEKELKGNDDPLLQVPGFRIGKSGVEKAFDKEMRGRAGNSQVEVNAVGRVIRELARNDGEKGQDTVLTVDAGLQKFAYERMAGESGAVVVMDVQNGDVLALVSVPGFDPNAFARGLSAAEWQEMTNNPLKPLGNKAIAGQYPPGSTYKVITALAGLEGGVTPSQGFPCSGSYQLGDTRFHCWLKGGHGGVSMHYGIVQSCDCYFYEVAKRAGVDKIADVALRFGLGKETGIEVPNELPGLVPTRQWKQSTFGQAWSQGETLNFGIGQGYMQATPLQLCVMTARIANGGYAVVPRLTRPADTPPTGPRFAKIKISPEHLKIVQDGMNAVVNSQQGTAYGARIIDPEYLMAGKTGTAQVKRITQAERDMGTRKLEDIPWQFRHHALFVGYGPVAKPRYAVAVVVEHGGGGSKAAAPVARDVLLECQKRDPSSTPPQMQTADLSADRKGGN